MGSWKNRTAVRAGRPLTVGSIERRLVSGPDGLIGSDRTAARVAVVTGVVFVFAGLVKFAFHHWELHAFRSFGLPFPSALEIVAGVVETVGGVLLALRRYVVPVGLVLAATMVAAIGASGIGHGDVIPSLTLAPVLLIALLYLLLRTNQPSRALRPPVPADDPE